MTMNQERFSPSTTELSGRKRTASLKQSRATLFLTGFFLLTAVAGHAPAMGSRRAEPITPNQFTGSDSDRIEAAIQAAKGTTNEVVIPSVNAATGTNLWLIDRAILLPSDMTVIIDNCTIQLSDQSRDNWFRSDNIGEGITDPGWNRNIAIIGLGKAMLKGANNPRATGGFNRPLTLGPFRDRVSYGTDAGKEGIKQLSDWRSNGIVIAQVDGFILRNVHLKNAHSWTISFERAHHVELSDLIVENHHYREIDGRMVYIANTDGINLRQGCKNFRINNISGITGDDFIALTSLDVGPRYYGHGLIHSGMLTTRKYRGPIDDTENIYISNISCRSSCNGIAIRANYDNRIFNVFIDGLYYEGEPNRNLRMPDPWNHEDSMPVGKNAILLGSSRYAGLDKEGEGDIRDIYAMNIFARKAGRGLVTIKGPVFDTAIMNAVNLDGNDEAITYFQYPHYTHTDRWKDDSIDIKNVITKNPDEIQTRDFFIGPESVRLSNFTEIGRPGNAADAIGFGAVEYPYLISKYAVSIAEWALFYNDQESGRIGDFRSDYNFWNVGDQRAGWMGTRHPAVHISFHQAAQYCNWLTTGSALRGAYTIDSAGTVTAVDRSFRNADGILYALPSENEWYKAAYFTGRGYSLYANGKNAAPEKSAHGLSGWNYGFALGRANPVSPVQKGSREQNGTYNMMGEVWEWLEDPAGAARGGAYSLDETFLASSSRLAADSPSSERTDIGFRVVALRTTP